MIIFSHCHLKNFARGVTRSFSTPKKKKLRFASSVYLFFITLRYLPSGTIRNRFHLLFNHSSYLRHTMLLRMYCTSCLSKLFTTDTRRIDQIIRGLKSRLSVQNCYDRWKDRYICRYQGAIGYEMITFNYLSLILILRIMFYS